MKKYLSVMKLYINEVFGRAAAVMAFLITGETGLYLLKGRHEPALGAALVSSRIGLFLAASFLMLIILPAYTQGTSGSRTLGRLRISNGATFLMGSLAYSLLFLLLWLVQACVLILLTFLYVRSPMYTQGTQGILAEFYRNGLFHALIPLRDTGILIRNGIICLSSGIATSYMRRSFENGKFGFAAVWAYLLAYISFRAESGGYTAAAFLLAISAYLIFVLIDTRSEENENDPAE